MPSDIERKLALLDLLASRRALTVAQIFEKLPDFYSAEGRDPASAKKMFERDKEDLAAMGFPLLAEIDEEVETYRLDPPDPALPSDFVLTDAETGTLGNILHDPVLRSQVPDPALAALLKLDELYTPASSAAAGTDAERPPSSALVNRLLAAVSKERALDIEYPDRTGKTARRNLSPWKLILKRGMPYLLAWCHRDRFPKMFSLARMGRVAASRDPYQGETEGFNIQRYVMTQDYLPRDSQDWRVRLRVEAPEAWRLEENARGAVEQRRPDGSVEAVFGVSNRERFFRYVLSFGSHAEILSPQEARDAFREFVGRQIQNRK